jgi:hypothetical protein|nr:MAG: hypothetical protein [Bacteriophage sp.]
MSNKKDCQHVDSSGRSAIIFSHKKWTGVYPQKVKGICKICKEQIEMTESEYKEFIKEGELS